MVGFDGNPYHRLFVSDDTRKCGEPFNLARVFYKEQLVYIKSKKEKR